LSLRLAFLDVDGTLTGERDPYVYLHRHLGTEAEGLAILNAYLAGEFNYDTFAQRDAALWKGQPVERIDALLAAIPDVPLAWAFAKSLQAAGVVLILVSSGLDHHVRRVADRIGAVEWMANGLIESGGYLTGEARVNVAWDGKGAIVSAVMARYGVHRDECLALGDGRGDMPMFAAVGHAVAVNPSDENVRGVAGAVLGEDDVLQWLAARGAAPGMRAD